MVSVIQVKGGEESRISLRPILASELAVMDGMGFYMVIRRDGKPLTEGDFNAIWRRQKAHLNLGSSQFHGLRKNATAALYEVGCTPQPVQSVKPATRHGTWCSITVGERGFKLPTPLLRKYKLIK